MYQPQGGYPRSFAAANVEGPLSRGREDNWQRTWAFTLRFQTIVLAVSDK